MIKQFYQSYFWSIIFLFMGDFNYPQNFCDHNTGNLLVSIFDNGWIGHGTGGGDGDGIIFEGNVEACFTAGILYGDPILGAVGMIGSGGYILDMHNIVPFSFDSSSSFNQISTFQMSDLSLFNMRVTQTTYSNTGDDFIFIKYSFLNSSGNNYSDLYFGIFCDWDVGGNNYLLNRGGIDQSRNLIYQWENGSAIDSNYYGIIAFNGLDGGTTDDTIPSLRIDVYNIMTVIAPPPDTDIDHRSFLGDGPNNLLNGESLIVGFGVVAGNNLTELQANADIAQSIWESVIVSVEDEETEILLTYSLSQNYPNPFNPSTNISWQLPVGSHQTLKIYDVLGNEVATLVDEYKPAGSYEVEWNAIELPSGIYFYQLNTDSYIETKKMLLLK